MRTVRTSEAYGVLRFEPYIDSEGTRQKCGKAFLDLLWEEIEVLPDDSPIKGSLWEHSCGKEWEPAERIAERELVAQ